MAYFAQDRSPNQRGASSRQAGAQIVSPTAQADNQTAQQQTPRVYEGYQPSSGRGEAAGVYEEKQPAAYDPNEQRAVMAALAANRCICEICTCGRHHCPSAVHLQARYEPNLASAYKDHYPRHEASIVRAKAPPSNVFSSDAPFEGQSTTATDFRGHGNAKPAPLMRPAPRSTVGGDEQRDFQSENASNYKSHGYARREASIPAHTMHVSNEPFQGQGRSSEDYQRWSARPAEIIKPQTNAAPTGPDDRDFATSSGVSYNAKGYVARQPAIPFTSHVFENEPFQGESSMKSDFKQWNVRPSESFKPKFNPADQLKDDRQWGTEKQDNFNNKGSAGVIRRTAPPSQVLESAPFGDQKSVTKSDFRGHGNAKPAPLMRPAPRSTVGGDEQRDFQSENASNYKSHGYARREASIPAHTMHVSNEPFQGQGRSSEDYQRWSARPAEIIKPQTNAAPTGPDDRDFATSSGVSYNAKGYVARQPAIPFTSHVFENEPFQGESSMKSDFKQWNVRPSESFKPKFNPADQLKDDRQWGTEKQDNFNNKGSAGVIRRTAPPSQVLESAPFGDQKSVTKSDFRGHGNAKPAPLMRPAPRSTVGGDEQRDFQSENASNYKSHGYARREASIPAHTMHVSNEPFQGQGRSSEDYQRWSARPAEIIKPQTNAAPTGPDDRDFATSSGVSYNAKGYVARQPAIPFTSHVFENTEDRDFETEARRHYTEKPIDVCPSESLKRRQQTKVVGGHLLYHHDAESNKYYSVDDKGQPIKV